MSNDLKFITTGTNGAWVKPVMIYTDCPECQGTGTVSGRTTYGAHDEEKWEHSCDKCKGSGLVGKKAFIEEL